MNKEYKKIAGMTLGGLAGVASLYLIVVLGYGFVSQLSGYPGATVAGVSVYGKNKSQIEKIVEAQAAEYQKAKITFVGSQSSTVDAADLGLKADAAQTADNVIAWSAANPFVLGTKKDFPIIFTADQAKLDTQLLAISDKLSSPAESPSYYLVDGQIKSKAGSVGNRVNLSSTAANFFNATGQLSKNVTVSEFSIAPGDGTGLTESENAELQARTKNPLTLSAGGAQFVASQDTLVSWIDPAGEQPTLAQQFGDDPFLAVISTGSSGESLFSAQSVSNYLTELSGQINKPAVNAQLGVTNGVVVANVASQNGQNLDVAGSTAAILDGLDSGNTSATLVVTTEKPTVREDNLAELGLKELVSTGYTNFSGSPANRLQNIRVGTARFNGVLISPNESFSFNDTLGPVDAEHGYLPELVILENKTKPEYGGGMCQVSSTAFRAALNAGMPILARTMHAYPVTYYKPYGVDATIYLPEPDLIFKNDTGHYILIQTHIEGTRLTFDFYGTKPARSVSFAGSDSANGAVPIVEQVTPSIYDQGVRGNNSFTAQFWRFIYDSTGKLVTKSTWISKYDSPDKYPH